MAKLHEEILVIKISTLVADKADVTEVISNDVIRNIEAVIQELLVEDQHRMIEIERA